MCERKIHSKNTIKFSLEQLQAKIYPTRQAYENVLEISELYCSRWQATVVQSVVPHVTDKAMNSSGE